MLGRLWKHGSIRSTLSIKELRRITEFRPKGPSESPGSPLSFYTWGNRHFSAEGSFQLCLFPPSRMFSFMSPSHHPPLPDSFGSTYVALEDPVVHCPPCGLFLPQHGERRKLGAEEWPPQNRRQSQLEPGLDMLKLLHNYPFTQLLTPSALQSHVHWWAMSPPLLRCPGTVRSGGLAKLKWSHCPHPSPHDPSGDYAKGKPRNIP